MSDDNQLLSQLTAKTKRLEAELKLARMTNKNQAAGGTSKVWLALDDSSQIKEEEETWFATYLDMMTLLLVLMIVMLAFAGQGDFISGADRVGSAAITGGAGDGEKPGAMVQKEGTGAHLGGVKQGEHLQNELAALGIDGVIDEVGDEEDRSLSELGFDQLGDDIDVIINGGVVSFRINSEILFTSGQADLGLAGIKVLKKLVDVLKKNDFQIAVEGHTDSVPIRGRYPSNWELSGSRAGSVVRYFEANGISSERLRAVGFADTRPLESNETAEGRAQNRRVELTMEIPK